MITCKVSGRFTKYVTGWCMIVLLAEVTAFFYEMCITTVNRVLQLEFSSVISLIVSEMSSSPDMIIRWHILHAGLL